MICNCQGGFFASVGPVRLKALEPDFARSYDRPADRWRLPVVPGRAHLALGVNLDLLDLIELRRLRR